MKKQQNIILYPPASVKSSIRSAWDRCPRGMAGGRFVARNCVSSLPGCPKA